MGNPWILLQVSLQAMFRRLMLGHRRMFLCLQNRQNVVMYGVPEKKRFTGLIGKELIKVCIGSNQVIFYFEGNSRISVESAFVYKKPDGTECRYDEFWRQDSSLPNWLGSSIREVDVLNRKTLVLLFSNGGIIKLTDDSDEYEAFQLNIEKELIVVWNVHVLTAAARISVEWPKA